MSPRKAKDSHRANVRAAVLGLTQAGPRTIRCVTLDLRRIGGIGHNLPDSAVRHTQEEAVCDHQSDARGSGFLH
jgi:hypothetical protein